jgi:NADH-quinone oxidoreductase subunit N
MVSFDYKLLLLRLLPETIVVLGALVVLFLDQACSKRLAPSARSTLATVLGVLTLAASVWLLTHQSAIGSFYRGMLILSPFTRMAKSCLAVLAIATLLVGRPAKFTIHIGEYVALLLLGTVGLLLLAGTEELLTAFIALELTSLSLYLLTGFNKQSIQSAEASLKYFLFGSVAAAFTLFGISLVFGLAGSTSFPEIAAALRNQELNPLMIAGLVLTAIGFAFKMAAAPLHLWAPDAYQGAPVPSAALIASASKLASLVLFFKFFVYAFPAQAGNASIGSGVPGWTVVIAAIAATSMIVGNLLAIAQSNFRRLIAYSAIAHAGYVMIAVLARNEVGLASAVYYLFTYGLSVIGAFGIVNVLEERHGELSINELAGLSQRAPVLALCLFVFMLSLAGIPPLAGFFGKFYVFLAALDASKNGGTPGLVWIVALALATSSVSFYYYLRVLKQAFVVETDRTVPVHVPFASSVTLALLAAAIVYFGCFPESLNGPLRKALAAQVEPHSPAASIPNPAPTLADAK